MLHEDTHYNDRPYDTILLDMDGVLADFHLQAVRCYLRTGRRFPELQHDGSPLQLSTRHFHKRWREIAPGSSLQKAFKIDKKTFWEPIDRDPFFWEQIDAYEWMKELVSEVRSYCRDLLICTSPHTTPDSYSGKVKWLIRHKLFPEYELWPSKRKWRLADRRTLLIDDHTTNILAFEEHAKRKGGEAFLFPAPCNRDHAKSLDPVMHVVSFLDQKFLALREQRYGKRS